MIFDLSKWFKRKKMIVINESSGSTENEFKEYYVSLCESDDSSLARTLRESEFIKIRLKNQVNKFDFIILLGEEFEVVRVTHNIESEKNHDLTTLHLNYFGKVN